MAYTRRRTSRPARSGYGARARSGSRRRTSVRRRAPVARRSTGRRRSGGQTVRLVIEHSTPSTQQGVDAMMHPTVQSTGRKAKF